MGAISDHFDRHKEQAFIVKAFITIAIILLVREHLRLYLLFLLFIILPFLFLSAVLAWSAYTGDRVIDIIRRNVTLFPSIYAEGGRKGGNIAWFTYAIVLINIAVFYLIEKNPLVGDGQFIWDNLLFLPEKPNFWNLPVSTITSMFLHADDWHLWGNMMFLWAVGTEVESRIDWKRFLALYFVTGILSGIVSVSVYYLSTGEASHGLGASGAISGIMGVFAVRCYFKTMNFPVPVLGILPIHFKVRMNSLVMMGLFFMFDLGGGIDQVKGESLSNVGHWAHLGGMVVGIVMAGMMKLGRDAVGERHTDIGLARLKEGVGLGEGEESLRTALESNGENVEAILALARTRSRRHGFRYTLTEEGAELYRKAMSLLISKDPKEAAEIYVEYFNKYQEGVEPALQFRIAGILYRNGDLDKACLALEMLADDGSTPAAIREKALFQAAKIMIDMDLHDAAGRYCERFLESFPQSAMASKVKAMKGG